MSTSIYLARLIGPPLAVIGHEGGTVLVVLNGLRLLWDPIRAGEAKPASTFRTQSALDDGRPAQRHAYSRKVPRRI